MKLGLTILINNACNLNCKYCYEENKGDEFLTYENVSSLINFFKKMPFFNKEVEFFGGEPTMSLNVIKRVVVENSDLKYRITSNGFFMRFSEYYYDFLSKFEDVTISVELTRDGFKKYRNRDDLKPFINKMINLHNKWGNIVANVSINSTLFENLDEFMENVMILINNDIGIHFYSLKSEDGFTVETFTKFLLEVKKRNIHVFNLLINKSEDKSDIEFTCTFDNKIVVNSDMNMVQCSWMKNKLGNILTLSDTEILNNYINEIAKNHKTCFNGCSSCDVELGKCSISCRAFFKDIERENNFKLLERLCHQERIKEYLRNE